MRLYKRGRIYWTWYYPDGKRKDVSTKCRDFRAAELVARRYERLAAAPADAAKDQTTLESACGAFRVERRNRGRAPDTLRYYDTKLGHLLRVLGAATPLDDITATSVDELIAIRLGEGASRSTVAKELGALRGVLRLAKRRGEYSGDVGSVLPEGWSSGYKPRKAHHSREQLDSLLAELPSDRASHVAFIVVTAARLGESVRARRSDFDLARSTIRVRGTKTPCAFREVTVFEHVADLAARAFLGAAQTGPAYRRWSNVRRDLEVACERAGVPKVTPNDLRRTPSKWLVERGAPSNLVAYFLGHSTSRMVELVYGKIDGRQLARAFDAVGIPTAAGLQRAPVNRRRGARAVHRDVKPGKRAKRAS